MKRFSIIGLICIYSLSTLGIGIRQFYCCGKLKSTVITFARESIEKCSKATGMSGCCQYKFKSYQLKDSHLVTDGIGTKHFSQPHFIAPSFKLTALVNRSMEIANTSHAPPLQHDIPLYILHGVFRI